MVRVLLVEDDASIADPLADTLRLQGFDVIHVNNGSAALHLAVGGPDMPDVVLLDLGLP
ncbi:MAG: response regulator transcription factor [Acidimicrobiia bacterium]